MIRLTKRRFVAILLVGSILVGCNTLQKASKLVGELTALQQKIADEFGETAVGIQVINDDLLAVNLTNSPSGKLPREEKAKRARAIATFARRNYPHSVERVNVAYVVEKSAAIVHYRSNLDSFTFSSAELAVPPLASATSSAP
jgi:hypothetical protein